MAVAGMVALLIVVFWSHDDTFVFKWCDTNYEPRHMCVVHWIVTTAMTAVLKPLYSCPPVVYLLHIFLI